MKNVAILTSGGDAPGINSYIWWLIKNSKKYNVNLIFIENGFKGLFENKVVSLDNKILEYNYYNGGTIIKTSRFPDLKDAKVQKKCAENLISRNIDFLVVVGGNGSFEGKETLEKFGIKTIGIPETIDNNVRDTVYSIGFLTAVETGANSIRALKDSAESHGRCFIIELMGDKKGDLTKYASIASKADICSTPEEPLSFKEISLKAKQLVNEGMTSLIVAITEKMHPDYQELIDLIESETKLLTRHYVLGFPQRGGPPTTLERFLAANLATVTLKYIQGNDKSANIGILGLEKFCVTTESGTEEISISLRDII